MCFIDRYVTDSLVLAGLLLEIMGMLYLVYDLLGRQPKWLRRGLWNGSSGVVAAIILLALYLIFVKTGIVSLQIPLRDLVRVAWAMGGGIIFIQFLKWDIFASEPNPPLFIWQNAWLAMIFPGSAIGVLGAFFGGTAGMLAFGSAGGVITGLLAGFSEGLQWRADNLPEKCLAVIGILLIGIGVVLALAMPIVDLFYCSFL